MKRRQIENRTRIIEELGKEDLRFEELLHRLPMSRGTLTSHLKTLLQEEKMEKHYSSLKSAVVYTIRPAVVIREIIIHEFVEYIGSRIVKQILQKEMGIIDEINLRKAFGFGTVEDFVHRKSKKEPVDYREILAILKEEYGGWIETEGVDDDF